MVTVAQARTQIADRPQMYPPMSDAPEIIGYADGVATQFALTYENAIPGTLSVSIAPQPVTAGVAPTFTVVSPNSPLNVATIGAAAVAAPGLATITPTGATAMTGIAVGDVLQFDPGLATQENVTVVTITGGGTSFTGVCAQAHAVGFTIVGAPFYAVGAPSPGTNDTAATSQVITFLAAPAAGSIIGARYQATAFSDADLADYLANAVAVGQPTDRLTLKQFQFDMIDVILSDQRRLEMLAQGDFKRDPASYVASLLKLKESLRKDLEGGPLPGTEVPALGVMTNGARRYLPIR